MNLIYKWSLSKIIVIWLSLQKIRAKKRRNFSISWLNLCYYNPSANSRQRRSYAGWRPINRQKNTRKNASTLPRLFRLFAQLVASRDYSHSLIWVCCVLYMVIGIVSYTLYLVLLSVLFSFTEWIAVMGRSVTQPFYPLLIYPILLL